MRLATYTQPSIAPRGSIFALFVLALTVILGSSALHTLMTHFAPQLHSAIALLWLVTYLVAFMGLMFGHGINWISWLSRYRILLVILLLGTIVSVSWSLDAVISAERVVHLIGCSVLGIYLGFMIPLLTTLRVSAVVLGVIMVASLGAALFMPSVGRQEYEGAVVWSGILNSKNALGFWASIAALLYVTLSASTQSLFLKFMCYLLAAVSLYLLFRSDSATSIMAMLVAGSLSLYLYIAFRFQLGFVRMVVLAILFGGLLGFALSNIDTAQILGRSGDLTGRGEVWRQTWKLIMDKPLTGYGYGSIWFPNDATLWIQQSLTDFTWVVYHAHNGFLQVASEIGLPLSCIALLMVAQQLIEIFYCQYERQQVGVLFVLAFVVAYLISNFSEARFLVNRELYWIFFIALPISMLRQINLKSIDLTDDEAVDGYSIGSKGVYSGAEVPLDKPWLRPMAQKEAALIGSGSGVAITGLDADIGGDTLDNGTNDETNKLPALAFQDEADIDLGGDEDISDEDVSDEYFDDKYFSDKYDGDDYANDQGVETSDYDESGNGDRTLDTTQNEPVDLDGTLEITRDPVDDIESLAHPYEEYRDELDAGPEGSDDAPVSHYKGGGDDVDRYDKTFHEDSEDDDDDEWVDIPLS